MGREYELKFKAEPENFSALRAHFPQLTPITMETAYYDTSDRALQKLRWTLRRRYENGQAVCTLKTPAENGSRGEWEILCGNILEAIPVLAEQSGFDNLPQLCQNGVEHVCGARFTRLACLLPTADGTAELALDEGVLLGGGKEEALMEVELELKTGSEKAADALAQEIADQFHLQPQKKSKYRRALLLAEGE